MFLLVADFATTRSQPQIFRGLQAWRFYRKNCNCCISWQQWELRIYCAEKVLSGVSSFWFSIFWCFILYFSPARWGLLDFIRAVLLILLLRLVLLLLLLPPPPPPPRPPPLLPPLPPLPLFANFGAQCALLDLNLGPSQLSAHHWTSTCSSVRPAGPQPGTCLAQCAPLDLNLGPSELSAHRWTSKAR